MTKQFLLLILISSILITGCQPDPANEDMDLTEDITGVCYEAVTGACEAFSLHPRIVDLSNNSCSGFCVMKRFLDSCPSDLNINGQDLTMAGYLSIFYDNSEFGFDDVIATNVLVHESMHSVAHTEANDVNDLFVLLDCENTWQVEMTNTFPSNELIPIIDSAHRTGRFEGYINASEFHVTQTRGVYGLLNEFMSYYQSGLATFEMSQSLNLLNDPTNALLYSINASIPYYEFKYWILTYLIYAEDNHPTVFAEVMANENFKESFLEIDQSFFNLTDQISSFADPLSSSTEENTVNVIIMLGSEPYLEMMSLLE